MAFINLTPHAVTFQRPDGSSVTIPPTAPPARVDTIPGAPNPDVDGMPVQGLPEMGPVIGLPAPAPGVTYVVSLMVAQALEGTRPDVVAPATGPKDGAIRDEKGLVVAVTRLLCAG